MENSREELLYATLFMDCDSVEVVQAAKKLIGSIPLNKRYERIGIAKAIIKYVKNDIQASTTGISLDPASYSASYVLYKGQGNGIQKAILLVTLARFFNIPAKLGLIELTSPDHPEALMSANLTGYADLLLEGKWKTVLLSGSMEQQDRLLTEPLHDYGTFTDVPYELIASSATLTPTSIHSTSLLLNEDMAHNDQTLEKTCA
ncbi:MAG: transglutaminase-like domain-containing protein [Pseudomonadales bacterium]|nr:transglutaminase-like domain-containing protein [Pseudomonadales bacterium]